MSIETGENVSRKEMAKLIDEIIELVKFTRDAGQDEYARDLDNAFANFERVASFTGTTREKALLTYMIKHLDGLCAYADGHRSQREDVRGRITDIIVYCFLLWGMVEDNEKEV
jgi:N-acetylneuraminic acid mutarotase